MADEPTMRELMLAGELYIADDPQIGIDSVNAQRLVRGRSRTGDSSASTSPG